MRNALLAGILVFAATLHAGAGDASRIFFPDLLPANTIACLAPPDDGSLEREYRGSVFQRIFDMPEMAPFLQSFEESRRLLAGDIAQAANVPPQFAVDLVESRLGMALINIGVARDGSPQFEYAFAISLPTQPDRATVYAAVMALLNRREVVRTVLESQGLDPNLPLKTLAQEETISGYPPILRIGPNIRVAALGNLVLFYHGPGSEGIKKLFDAASNPAQSLGRNPAFQAAYMGAEASSGSSFVYLNAPRLMSILDVLNMVEVSRIADALGLGTVQSLGLAGNFRQEGVRHSLYIHVPGGQTSGLMSTLIPMAPEAPIGMEGFGRTIPAAGEAFMSLRVDLPAFLRELPYLLNSISALVRPGGVTSVLGNETVLGVPLQDIIRTLGNELVVRPHDDTMVMTFQNVDIPAFEATIARMEQNAGQRFNMLNVGGYIVRYFNRRASLSSPLAPAFCLVPRTPGGNRGILYMSSHPQAVASLIIESTGARERLSDTADFVRTAAGIGGGNYSLYYYNGNREGYRRVYNFLLPIASLWASSSRYPVDTGLLPISQSVVPSFFGCSLGIRSLPEGMQIQAYSPIGFNALLVALLDKLVVSNPLVIGYAYSLIEEWMHTLPAW